MESSAAPGRTAFRIAAIWLFVSAGLEILGAAVALSVLSDWSGPDSAVRPVLLAAASAAAALIALRAASGRLGAVIAALVLGIAVAGRILTLMLDPLMPWNDALYGVSLGAFGALWLPVAVLGPPATLAILGSVQRWCAAGRETASRRARLALLVSAIATLPFVALAIVDYAAPLCPPGRVCIPAANLSLTLPDGWSRRGAGDGLFEAGQGDSRRIVIDDAQELIGPVGSLDELMPIVTDRLSSGELGYSHSHVTSQRVELPVGPAIRVTYVSTPWFYQVEQNNITEWFFIDGRLAMISYQEVPPGSASDDFDLVRTSLEVMKD